MRNWIACTRCLIRTHDGVAKMTGGKACASTTRPAGPVFQAILTFIVGAMVGTIYARTASMRHLWIPPNWIGVPVRKSAAMHVTTYPAR